MKSVKFIIRDQSGHSQKLVPPEQVDDFADELRDKGYMMIANNMLIPYGSTLQGLATVEAVPVPTKG